MVKYTVGAILLVMALMLISVGGNAAEFRAMWVDGWSGGMWTTGEIDAMLDCAQQGHYNVIVPEIRKKADALWNSTYGGPAGTGEPKPSQVQPPEFDPLAYMVEQAHARGIQVHPLIITHRVTTVSTDWFYTWCGPWLTRDSSNALVFSEGWWLDPGVPDGEEYTTNVIMDVVSHYDIDGINWDRIRYPGPDSGWNTIALARFYAQYGYYPGYGDSTFGNWRRKQLNDFVARVYAQIMEVKPNIAVSASTWMNYSSGSGSYFQDTAAWMAGRWLDIDIPMNYTTSNTSFNSYLTTHLNNRGARYVFSGYNLGVNTQANAVQQILNARSLENSKQGVIGECMYSYRYGTQSAGWWSYVSASGRPYQYTDTIPALPWKTDGTNTILLGRVTDASHPNNVYYHDWIQGATVNLYHAGPPVINRTTTTDQTGYYVFTNVAQKTSGYTVTISQTGFAPRTYPNRAISGGQVLRIDSELGTDFGAQLSVSPTTDMASSGAVGGPFSPTSQTYTVTNDGPVNMNWTASKTQSWVTLSSTGGTLGPGVSATVVVSLYQPQNLPVGDYSDTVSFVNTTNGHGNTTRSVSLAVRNAYLGVTPIDGFVSYGEPTGSFTQLSKTYTVTNIGYTTLNWTAAKSQSWVSLSSTGGVLAPGASTDVTATLTSAIEDFPLGAYSDAVVFTNTTNGGGNTTRNITFTVAHNYFVDPVAFDWADPGNTAFVLSDNGVASCSIPFTFFFYGQPYTTLYIGANGLLGFNSALSAADNTDLPTVAVPSDAIYPYWDDLNPALGGGVFVNVVGDEPNRKLVITWQGVPHAGSANPLTFQALLCEGSNDIIFQYLEVQPADMDYGAGRSATIGLENASGTVARVYSVNGSTLLTNNLAVRFTMDPGDISELKKLPTNASICIHRAIISCACSSLFYIESDDRSCGIMVNKPAHGFPAGIRVDVEGTLSTGGTGEKYIKNPTIMPNGKGSVKPLTATNRALGGQDYYYDAITGAGQTGVKNPYGLNNIGLLVRVTGRVTFTGDTFFYTDDGSKLNDGSGYTGVRVVGTEVTMPPAGKYVSFIGASSCWKNGSSDVQPQIRPPSQVIVQYD
jgi:uncharacterized lipoprotein YddW (UPF0748 family)